jgi:hypothetical protein
MAGVSAHQPPKSDFHERILRHNHADVADEMDYAMVVNTKLAVASI